MANIVCIDRSNFSHAASYYEMVTWEPIADGESLVLGRIFDIRQLNIEKILDHIIAHLPSQQDSLIIVCHANPDGLILPFMQGPGVKASREAFNLLSSTRTDAEVAPLLGLSENQLSILRSKQQQVQAKSLKRLEIRGCRVGSSEPTLGAIKRFFGVRQVGAPSVFNAYGRLRVRATPGYDFTRYDNGGDGRHFHTNPADNVGMEFQRVGATGFTLRNVRTSSRAAFQRWGNAMFPIRQTIRLAFPPYGASVNLHLDPQTNTFDTNLMDNIPYPNMPVHFQLTSTNDLYFPLESTYRDNLVSVEHTAEPASLGF